MKIATYNVNGINVATAAAARVAGRGISPDIACLQELKTSDATFPEAAIADAGYRRDLARTEGFQRRRDPRERHRIRWNGGAACRPTPTTPTAATSKLRSNGIIVASIYLPNGNPQPGPKFDYKLAWFERLDPARVARCATAASRSCWRATTTSCPPTRVGDIYSPASWRHDALLQPETSDAYRRLLGQGWTDAIRAIHPDAPMYTYWDFFSNRWERNAGLRIDHLLLNEQAASALRTRASTARFAAAKNRATTRPAWVRLR